MKGGGDAVSAARAVLQTGEYDYAWNLQVEDELLIRLEQGGKGKTSIVPGGNIEFIQLNMADPWTETDGERFLQEYLQVARRTLQGSFGKQFRSIIFQGTAPLRVVALDLIGDAEGSIQSLVVEESEHALEQALSKVNGYLAEQLSQNVFILRNVRAYIGKTVYIIKPDQRRHWTRSNALRDADEIYSDIMEDWRSAS